MTVERVIDVLTGLISPENAEEENEALGKAAKILQLSYCPRCGAKMDGGKS